MVNAPYIQTKKLLYNNSTDSTSNLNEGVWYLRNYAHFDFNTVHNRPNRIINP